MKTVLLLTFTVWAFLLCVFCLIAIFSEYSPLVKSCCSNWIKKKEKPKLKFLIMSKCVRCEAGYPYNNFVLNERGEPKEAESTAKVFVCKLCGGVGFIGFSGGVSEIDYDSNPDGPFTNVEWVEAVGAWRFRS